MKKTSIREPLRLLALYALLTIWLLASSVYAQQKNTQQQAATACMCCALEEAPESLSYVTQVAPDSVKGQRIIIKGRVFESDGKTPASNVVMYFYHTNAQGVYGKATSDHNSQAWWHGYNRGWLKTNAKGEYEFHTIRPAPYPSRNEPAHIHCAIKSPAQTKCYGIHDFVFTDDPLVTGRYWHTWENQGLMRYAGVDLKTNSKGVPEGIRDITLLPQYDRIAVNSGPLIGEDCPAFDPHHVWGPDKGTRACPMCKYGYQQGVLAWINTDDFANVKRLAVALEKEIEQKGTKRIRAFIIYMNPEGKPIEGVEKLLSDFARSSGLRRVAVTYIPTPTDLATATLYKINPDKGIRNTVIVYKSRGVFDKYVNFDSTPENLKELIGAVARAEATK